MTVATKGAQFWLFPRSIRHLLRSVKENRNVKATMSGYRALCTVLGATVGTGNLAGVAGAISIGGPGAVFWIWISGFLGMIIKFSEVTLAVFTRKKSDGGGYLGGPMYVIEYAFKKQNHTLAVLFSFFGVIAAFGIGNMTQVNTMIVGIQSVVNIEGCGNWGVNLIAGIILTMFIVAVLKGGIQKIGNITEIIVPIAAGGYVILALIQLLLCRGQIMVALTNIIRGAFTPKAVTGGMVGSAFITMRIGISRGVFSNEGGLGTAGIAHACADIKDPYSQGLMGIAEVFIDTHVICTLTALVILSSGIVIPYGQDAGALLTIEAFSSVYGSWIRIPITVIICILSVATILGWGLYGASCAQYLFGIDIWNRFAYLQGAAVMVGALMNTAVAWKIAEIVNGLMAIPNLIATAMLSPLCIRLLRENRKSVQNQRICTLHH